MLTHKKITLFAGVLLLSLLAVLAWQYRTVSARHHLDVSDPEALVAQLDQASGDSGLRRASLVGDQLILQDRLGTQTITLDRFYLSLAPYEQLTHACENHSLLTCRGELSETEMTLSIVQDDGTVLFDGPITTYANGFYGVFLPKQIGATVTVQKGTAQATTHIRTDADAASCLTTLQLN